ncbi:MAG TPA: hypothetical protein VJZ91_07385, partial [Blastocatellia bacterium]|nr:hypothetical protein [Blastocatellia bacterium]
SIFSQAKPRDAPARTSFFSECRQVECSQMPRLSEYTMTDITDLQERLHVGVMGCASLQEAAQKCVGVIYEDLEDSLALARIYATVPFKQLPATDRSFVLDLAMANRAADLLDEETLVLSLLGTRGDESEWNDRNQSKNHLGIPLLASSFVDAIPMVAQLMQDLQIGLGWLDSKDTNIVVKTLGTVAGVFYVQEAATSVDEKGRKIVPAQDFVRAHRVETVFGLGGSYLNSTCVVLILFTRERLERAEAERFMPLVNTIKSVTMGLVMRGQIFE